VDCSVSALIGRTLSTHVAPLSRPLYLVLEFGASYPLLGYLVSPHEEFDEPTALDPVIYAGLLHP
jgi:hypothetical protein